jgi:hypothetical protein
VSSKVEGKGDGKESKGAEAKERGICTEFTLKVRRIFVVISSSSF